MMYKNINIQKSIILHLIFTYCISISTFAQGLNINRLESQKIPYATDFSNKSLGKILPSEFSLDNFVPEVIDQGNFNTCVPIATLYYAAGIRLSYVLQVKNKNIIQKELSLAPLYNWQLAGFDCHNSQGTGLYDMALNLNTTGGIPFGYFPYLSCEPIIKNSAPRIFAQKIQKFCEWNPKLNKCVANDDIITNLKLYLNAGYPIVVGIPSAILPSNNQNKSKYHVVTLLGWTANGFMFVNSWGNSWANSGFSTLSFETLRKNLLGAFCFDLDLKYAKSITDKFDSELTLAFEMNLNRIIKNRDDKGKIKEIKQKEIPIFNPEGYYSFKLGSLASLNEYQLQYKHLKKYIKTYSFDSKNKTLKLLDINDPTSNNSPNRTLPSPNASYKFLEQGSDYLIIFVSNEYIPEPLFPDLSKSIEGLTVPQQLVKAFGKNINLLKTQIGFDIENNNLPIIIEIEH